MRQAFIEAFGHSSSAQDVESFLAQAYSAKQQAAELDDPAVVTRVVESADHAWAGFGQLRFASPPPESITLRQPAELGRLYVLAAYHGQGLGSALMDWVHAESVARGSDGLWLSVWQQAQRSIAFYRRHGFEIVGRATFRVGTDVQDDWVMQKRF